MIWSSFAKKQYCEAISYSDNGSIFGKWLHEDRLLFEENGGHGMLFETFDKELMFIQHSPNNPPDERPCIFKVTEKEQSLFID